MSKATTTTVVTALCFLLLSLASTSHAFVGVGSSSSSRTTTTTTTTQLHFGIPTFGAKSTKDDDNKNNNNDKKDDDEKKIGMSGLLQLITAGMGSPFLGDFEGVDEETGKMMFSLEANNLVDEKGRSKQTQMPYFESGWVDEKDLEKSNEPFKFPWQK